MTRLTIPSLSILSLLFIACSAPDSVTPLESSGDDPNSNTGAPGDGDGDGATNLPGDGDQTSSTGGNTSTTGDTPGGPAAGSELCGTTVQPLSGGNTGHGHGTRYWDCCMPHCSWSNNTSNLASVCSVDDAPVELLVSEDGNTLAQSGCNQADGVYTCSNQSPWAACDDLAFGFAAVPLAGPDACGSCFLLEFDGRNKQVEFDQNAQPDPGSIQLQGKQMIVMASNTGGDVGGGQFDLMIPGGGVGIFPQGCQNQWGSVDESVYGPTHGGMRTACQEQWNQQQAQQGGEWEPHMPLADMQACVRSRCEMAFAGNANLLAGCNFYVDWMGAADNPTFSYTQVECPAALAERY